MNMIHTLKRLLPAATSTLAALSLISCAATTPPPQQPAPIIARAPAPVQPAIPAPPPPVNIPKRAVNVRMEETLVRAAGNHAVLMSHITQIPILGISAPSELNAMMDGAAQVYSPSLGPSLIGYGALVGVQNTSFVESVMDAARYQGLDTIVYKLYADPNFAATLPGAQHASADIQNAWASDIAQIGRSGSFVKQQSYELQKSSDWKTLRADDRTSRLQALEQAKSIRYTPPRAARQSLAEIGTIRAYDTDADMRRRQFWQVYGRSAQPQTETYTSQYASPMHRKALTLSALEILGATGTDSSVWIDNYMVSPKLNRCITTARLNAAQCVAAGHFKYEDAFCAAEHQLTEISNCLTQNLL